MEHIALLLEKIKSRGVNNSRQPQVANATASEYFEINRRRAFIIIVKLEKKYFLLSVDAAVMASTLLFLLITL